MAVLPVDVLNSTGNRPVLTNRVLVPHGRDTNSGPYEDALRQAGLDIELVVSPFDAPLTGFGGLVLVGGTDVDPRLYGQEAQPETEPPDTERDRLEFRLLDEAIRAGLPVLAICRGIQLLNVFLGGTLIQHLDSARHRKKPANRWEPAHSIDVVPGTLLDEIAAAREWQVNSRHHQAIDRLGRGLRVAARDPEDKIIEAVDLPDRRFVLGVQWHPEDQVSHNSEQRRLFDAFAAVVNGDERP